jgi:SM-20-related protein
MQILIDGIATDGYVIVNDFLPPQKIAALADEAKTLLEAGAMRRARVGRDITAPPDNRVRGDFIHWLAERSESDDISPGATQQEYLALMESLRLQLNRELYLGLQDVESHFTVYPPGAFYRKHLDQFQGSSQRQISSILYLNQDWQPEHGGELRLYLDGTNDASCLDVTPAGGTLVLFLSARFWHEVLPATRERISLTGWFRTRG